MQDIAGCRLVVADTFVQKIVIDYFEKALGDGLFQDIKIVDRRIKPSNDYRAVHIIVRSHDKLVEVQLRTALQHRWAELSEKLADTVDPKIKYGGGEKNVRSLLHRSSSLINDLEIIELGFLSATYAFPDYRTRPDIDHQHMIDEETSINDTKSAVLGIMEKLANIVGDKGK